MCCTVKIMENFHFSCCAALQCALCVGGVTAARSCGCDASPREVTPERTHTLRYRAEWPCGII